MTASFRVGIGYDSHRFDESRPLILGGVKISDRGGLSGHSDADALIHAIIDALSGAAGLPDIGEQFPDTDEKYRGVDSRELLKVTKSALDDKGLTISNIDTTIIAETPKMTPHKQEMAETIAEILNLDPAQVSVKATTNEKMGFVGRGEGIAVIATALLQTGEKDNS